MGLLGWLIEALVGAGYEEEAAEISQAGFTMERVSDHTRNIAYRAMRHSGEFANSDCGPRDIRERGLYRGRRSR